MCAGLLCAAALVCTAAFAAADAGAAALAPCRHTQPIAAIKRLATLQQEDDRSPAGGGFAQPRPRRLGLGGVARCAATGG
jgi:hypothetical protein